MACHCQQQQAEAAMSATAREMLNKWRNGQIMPVNRQISYQVIYYKEQIKNWKAKVNAMNAVWREKILSRNELLNLSRIQQVDLQEKNLKIENLKKEVANLEKAVNEKNYNECNMRSEIEQYKKDLAHKDRIIENMKVLNEQKSLKFQILKEAHSNRIGEEAVNVGASRSRNAEQKELNQNQSQNKQTDAATGPLDCEVGIRHLSDYAIEVKKPLPQLLSPLKSSPFPKKPTATGNSSDLVSEKTVSSNDSGVHCRLFRNSVVHGSNMTTAHSGYEVSIPCSYLGNGKHCVEVPFNKDFSFSMKSSDGRPVVVMEFVVSEDMATVNMNGKRTKSQSSEGPQKMLVVEQGNSNSYNLKTSVSRFLGTDATSSSPFIASQSLNETDYRAHLALRDFNYQKSAEDCYQTVMHCLKELLGPQRSSKQWFNTLKIVVEFLGDRSNDAMKMFVDSQDPVMLYPTAERCIARTLISIHESNTNLRYDVPIWERFLRLTLLKLEAWDTMSIFGQAALGRVFMALCIEYNMPDLPERLMKSYMKLPSSKAFYLLACIGGAFPNYLRAQQEAFHMNMQTCFYNIPENVDADDRSLIRGSLFMLTKVFPEWPTN